MTLNNKPLINWRTFLICVTISLGQVVGAYESALIGTTLQKTDFMQRMGLWDSDGNQTPDYSSREGAIVGLFQVRLTFCLSRLVLLFATWYFFMPAFTDRRFSVAPCLATSLLQLSWTAGAARLA
jgi:hypothetical protein